MSTPCTLKQTIIAALVGIVALAVAAAPGDRTLVSAPASRPQSSVEQPSDTAAQERVVEPREQPRYLGTSQCQFCHYEGKLPRATPEELRNVLGRVRLDELRIWEMYDPHRQAFTALSSPRAKEMHARLNAMRAGSDRPAIPDLTHTISGCASCHTIAAAAEHFHPSIDAAAVRREGVSCEACHGPASAWYLPHSQFQTNWLAKTPPEIKERKFGLIDMHDPRRRAEVCLSCHVGDARRQRLVTHEMYVAGHPPLSGFEIETAAERLPRHWCYPEEGRLGAAKLHSNGEAAHAQVAISDPYVRTRNVLVANLVALRESVRMMDATSWQPTVKGAPEFSRFDCFACHHELGGGDRQSRGSFARPGRPAVRHWSLPLAMATAERFHTDQNKLVAHLTHIHQALDEDAFGRQLTTAEHPLIGWCNQVIEQVRETPLTEELVRAYLQQLCRQRQRGLLAARGMDFDAARQLVGAMWIMQNELAQADTDISISAQQRERMAKLRKLVGLDNKLYERPRDFYTALTELSQAAQGKRAPAYDAGAYDAALGTRLQKRANYSAAHFDRLLRDFAATLQQYQ